MKLSLTSKRIIQSLIFFPVNQFDRQMLSRKVTALTGLMLGQTAFQVIRTSNIVSTIGTPENISICD